MTTEAKKSFKAVDIDIKKLFFGCLMAGVGLIVADQYLKFPSYLGIALPVSAQLIYIIIGYRATEMTEQREEVADSSYYMGFVLTLVAMICSLFSLNVGAQGAQYIVSEFGLALITTVVGLIAKIWMSTFDEGLSPSRRAATRALEQNTRKFVKTLSKNSESLDSHYAQMKGSVIGMQEELQGSILDTAEKAGQHIATSAESFSEGLSESLTNLKGQIDKFSIDETALTKELSPALTQLANELVRCTESVAKQSEILEERVDQSEKLEYAYKQINQFIKALKKVTDTHEKSSEIAERANQLYETQLKHVVRFTTILEKSESSVQSLSSEHDSLIERLKLADRQLEKYIENLSLLSSKTKGELESLGTVDQREKLAAMREQIGTRSPEGS